MRSEKGGGGVGGGLSAGITILSLNIFSPWIKTLVMDWGSHMIAKYQPLTTIIGKFTPQDG